MGEKNANAGAVSVGFDYSIEQRFLRNDVCVGTIAWAEDDLDNGFRDASDVINDFKDVYALAPMSADIVLCAGAKVRVSGFHGATARRDALSEFSKQLASIAGCPVLFESPDLTHGKQWYLATRRDRVLVRTGQYVFDHSNVGCWDDLKLLAELHAGYGTIRITSAGMQIGPTLALLICGEVRVLRTGATSGSLFVNDHTDLIVTPALFNKCWALLHPAHHPYWPHNSHKGFGLVGELAGKPAQFQRLVDRPQGSTEDPQPPNAVVHAGVYRNASDAKGRDDADYATMCFRPSLGASPALATNPWQGLGNALRYAEFEV